MKKIFLFIIFASLDLNAQESGVNVNIRLFDIDKTWVVYSENPTKVGLWEELLFANGFDVGDWYIEKTNKDGNNRETTLKTTRIVNGTYFMDIRYKTVTIENVYTDKLVGTISFKRKGFLTNRKKVDYALKSIKAKFFDLLNKALEEDPDGRFPDN